MRVLTIEEAVAEVRQFETNRLVISGGEPLIQQAALVDFLEKLDAEWVEIETAGTLAPLPQLWMGVDQFNVSPKLAHSGNDMRKARKLDVLRLFTRHPSVFKFVAQSVEDLDEVADVVQKARIPKERVWIMPEGTDADTLQTKAMLLSEAVLERGWNLTLRMQVELWGARRGH